MKTLFFLTFLLIGCSSNNQNIEKIAEANSLLQSEKYDKAISILKELNEESSDKQTVSALANAHLQYGNFLMYNEELDRKVRYVSALKEYRAALALDNNLAEARSNAELIESIYKSMGREIPN